MLTAPVRTGLMCSHRAHTVLDPVGAQYSLGVLVLLDDAWYSHGAVCLFQEVLALIAELNAGEPRTGA